jgi:hypothetical protein
MATKAQQDLIHQAIKDLHITGPIYTVQDLPGGGLRLWVYGHHEPLDWTPHSDAAKPTRSRTKKAAT